MTNPAPHCNPINCPAVSIFGRSAPLLQATIFSLRRGYPTPQGTPWIGLGSTNRGQAIIATPKLWDDEQQAFWTCPEMMIASDQVSVSPGSDSIVVSVP
jgi:hypothetical protein